jgi:hypothetical protein
VSFLYEVPLKDLLTFFLFVDLVVMFAVGIIMYKTRHKKGKTEQLLEEIRDTLRHNAQGCAEKPLSKSTSDLTNNVKNALKKVVEIKEEAAEEKPPDNKVSGSKIADESRLMRKDINQLAKKEVPTSPINQERIYYEIEESKDPSNDESSDLNLVKNALKDGPVIKPLLKMPKYIEDLVNKNRQSESQADQTEVAPSAESTVLPPPPPLAPTQTANTKNNEQQKE